MPPKIKAPLQAPDAGGNDAEVEATRVFATNLSALLLQRPVRGVAILGVDPGFAHGCKLAVVSARRPPAQVHGSRTQRHQRRTSALERSQGTSSKHGNQPTVYQSTF